MKKIETTNDFKFLSHKINVDISELEVKIKGQEFELNTAMSPCELFVQNLTVSTRLDRDNEQREYIHGTFTQHRNNDLIFLTSKELSDFDTQIIISLETERDDKFLEKIKKRSDEEKIFDKNLGDFQKFKDIVKYNTLMSFSEAHTMDEDPTPDHPNMIMIDTYLNKEMYNSLKALILAKNLSKFVLTLRSNNIFQAGTLAPSWALHKQEPFYFYFTNSKEANEGYGYLAANSEVEFGSKKLENKTADELEEENIAKKEKRKFRMLQWKKTSKVRFYTIAVLLIIIIFLLLSNS
tara:strand:- start:1673 stop:2554 length:882 start_codon:yes stop_codon:yes gene_type:complete